MDNKLFKETYRARAEEEAQKLNEEIQALYSASPWWYRVLMKIADKVNKILASLDNK